jgi:hypothetical protein
MGSSIESFEREGVEGLIDEENPEMILMGKELLQERPSHFGNNDLDVIFGVKDNELKQNAWGSITMPTVSDCNGNSPSSDPFSKMTDTTSTDPTKTKGSSLTASPFPILFLSITFASDTHHLVESPSSSSPGDTHHPAKVPFVTQPGVISSFC